MGGEEEIIHVFDSPGVVKSYLHTTCSLEMIPVSWPISINPADLFLFFIWSYFHLLPLVLLISFSLLHLSADASER